MARYEEWEVTALDIDWFAVDRSGYVGHFTTGGGVCPPFAVSMDKDLNARLLAFVLDLPVVTDAVRWEPTLRDKSLVGSASDYFADYEEFARRGLFSFDVCLKHEADGSATYMCIAAPQSNLLHSHRMRSWLPVLEHAAFDEVEFRLGGVVRP